MFSADDIETIQQVFVQAFCFNWRSKFASTMDEGETSVSENGVQNYKMAERTSMFTTALFGTVLQKGVWT